MFKKFLSSLTGAHQLENLASPRITRRRIIERAQARLCADHVRHLEACERLERRIARDQAKLEQHRLTRMAIMEALVAFQTQEIEAEGIPDLS